MMSEPEDLSVGPFKIQTQKEMTIKKETENRCIVGDFKWPKMCSWSP